jgi:multiple sugar transport system permease protein
MASNLDHGAVTAPGVPRVGRRPTPGIRARLRPLVPYLLMAPAMLFLAYFLFWPALGAFGVAFQTASGQWTLANFQEMVRDTDFGLAIRNTLLLLAIIIPLEFVVALAMAVLAQSRLRGRGFFLYVWSFPLAISDLAAGLVWLSIFTSRGYLSSALQDLHVTQHPLGLLNYDNIPGLVVAVVVAETWRSISLVMVVIMSGIQAIPADLGEAAAIMGASAWQRFTKVTLPLLKPTLQVGLMLRTTAAFQVFAVVLALTGSGLPVLATKTFSSAYAARNYQLAAAYAVLLLILSSFATVAYLTFLRTPRQVFQR